MTHDIGSLIYVPANPNAVSDDYASAVVVAVFPNPAEDANDTANVRVFHNSNEVEWRTDVVIGDAPEQGSKEAPGNVGWEPGSSAPAETPTAAPAKATASSEKGA